MGVGIIKIFIAWNKKKMLIEIKDPQQKTRNKKF